jgi:hypothetical protein
VLSPPRSAGSSSLVIGLPGEETRGLAEDFTLLASSGLTAQPAQLLTLGRGEAVAAAAGIQVSALDPLVDRGLGQGLTPESNEIRSGHRLSVRRPTF